MKSEMQFCRSRPSQRHRVRESRGSGGGGGGGGDGIGGVCAGEGGAGEGGRAPSRDEGEEVDVLRGP